jgi:hypothetical protein
VTIFGLVPVGSADRPEQDGRVNRQLQAVLSGVVAFAVSFAVIYLVGHLIATLIIALAALAAGGYSALVVYRYVDRHGVTGNPQDPPSLGG